MPRTEVTGSQIKDSTVNLTADVAGILPVSKGGSGADSIALNNVVLGNGTGAVQTVAPGTSGNVLTSNGSTWVSGTPQAGATGPVGPSGPTGPTGPTGPAVDNIIVINDSLQFYAGGSTVGSPVVVPGAILDGGSPTSTSEGSIDGGTL